MRHILLHALETEARDRRGLGSRIAARFATLGLAEDLVEVRGGVPRPASFDE